MDDDVGDPGIFIGLGRCGRVAATNPKSSPLSSIVDEPSSLIDPSANGLGGVSFWLGFGAQLP